MPRNRGWWRGGLALLASIVALPAAATTVLGLSIPALAAHSDRVIEGRVASVATRRDAAGALHTFTTVVVRQDLLGGGGPRAVVRQLGGRVGHRVSRVLGDARFRVGEEVVLFLRRDPRDPAIWHLTALAAAKFTVVRGAGPAMAVRDLSGLDVVGADGRPRTIPTRLTLAALEAAVAQAPDRGGGRRVVP